MLTSEEWVLIRQAAERQGLSPWTPKQWRKRKSIPAERVPDLSQETGIPEARLNPAFARKGRAA